jgi:hypothetical protein
MQQVAGFVKQTRVRPASWALGMSLYRARAKTVNFDKVEQRTLPYHNFESLLLLGIASGVLELGLRKCCGFVSV